MKLSARLGGLFALFIWLCTLQAQEVARPNVLIAIADDQSFPYASAYGDSTAITPAFDAVAARGVLFMKAHTAAPGCSPSRAAMLTGLNIWQLEEAGTHASYFPDHFQTFTGRFEEAGYAVGYTGKGWGPGNWRDAGWKRNPAGYAYNDLQLEQVPYDGINRRDYSGNFRQFMDQKPDGQPFCFWYGAHEPHLRYEQGSGLDAGKKLEQATVPPFLPDHPIVRGDLLDYAVEIEWFDRHLGLILEELARRGELENTLIVVTADNGMPFPYAKANLENYGTHVPLAMAGPGILASGVMENPVSLIDIGPTLLEAARLDTLPDASGRSLWPLLSGETALPHRAWVLTGRERHTHARPDNLGYPSRAIRNQDYLYIWNLKPDRWPAGDPPVDVDNPTPNENFTSMQPGYHDIDGMPTKTLLLENRDELGHYTDLATAKRPAEELYYLPDDPGCLQNLADNPAYEAIRLELHTILERELSRQGDPRMRGSEVFESYPRMSPMRMFPGFRIRGEYNPAYQGER